MTIAFVVFVVWLVVGTVLVLRHFFEQTGNMDSRQRRSAFWSFMSAIGSGGLFRFMGISDMPQPPEFDDVKAGRPDEKVIHINDTATEAEEDDSKERPS